MTKVASTESDLNHTFFTTYKYTVTGVYSSHFGGGGEFGEEGDGLGDVDEQGGQNGRKKRR